MQGEIEKQELSRETRNITGRASRGRQSPPAVIEVKKGSGQMGKIAMATAGVLLALLLPVSCFSEAREKNTAEFSGTEGIEWPVIETGGIAVSAAAGARRPFLILDAAGKASDLTGTVWLWVETVYSDDRRVAPADSRKYTVEFREDETLNVKADCNRKGGSYSSSPGDRRLSIAITHSTMAACPEGSLESEFERELNAAFSYFIKNGDLYLDLKFDSGTMRFSK
jgi:heat shock protein HslJ